jgi:hypothetical protein
MTLSPLGTSQGLGGCSMMIGVEESLSQTQSNKMLVSNTPAVWTQASTHCPHFTTGAQTTGTSALESKRSWWWCLGVAKSLFCAQLITPSFPSLTVAVLLVLQGVGLELAKYKRSLPFLASVHSHIKSHMQIHIWKVKKKKKQSVFMFQETAMGDSWWNWLNHATVLISYQQSCNLSFGERAHMYLSWCLLMAVMSTSVAWLYWGQTLKRTLY